MTMRTDTKTSPPQGGSTVKAPKKTTPAPSPMHAAMMAQPSNDGGAIQTWRDHQAHLDQTIHAGGAQQAQNRKGG